MAVMPCCSEVAQASPALTEQPDSPQCLLPPSDQPLVPHITGSKFRRALDLHVWGRGRVSNMLREGQI
eukprot:1157252-Pelagomonas_calceolata.AAC.2